MEKWFRVHEGEIKSLDNDELKIELRAQRYCQKVLKESLFRAEVNLQKAKAALEKSLNDENTRNSVISKQRGAITRWENIIILMKDIQAPCEAHVELLEAESALRQRVGRSASGNLKEKKRIKYRRETINERFVKRSESVEKTWNKEAFLAIAEDRGYKIYESLLNDVARLWNLSVRTTKNILNNGKFTWGQVLLLGHLLEMTPKEFAETFMRGYFEEVAEGQFRAWGDKDELVYTPPPKHEYVQPETVIYVDESGEEVTEQDYFETFWDE